MESFPCGAVRVTKGENLLETLESILPYLQRYSYVGLYGLILACSFGFPFSKTLLLLAGGILASQGVGNLYLYMIIGLAGLVTADGIYFLLGFYGQRRILTWRDFARPKFIEALREAETTYQRQRWWAVFSARFTPFVRTVIFLAAGLSRMSPVRFLSADFLSALFFVPFLSFTGYFFSANRRVLVQYIKEGEVVLAVVALVALALFFIVSKKRKKGGVPKNKGER